jgi:hypothetical protein
MLCRFGSRLTLFLEMTAFRQLEHGVAKSNTFGPPKGTLLKSSVANSALWRSLDDHPVLLSRK